jgi:hypothetical protein
MWLRGAVWLVILLEGLGVGNAVVAHQGGRSRAERTTVALVARKARAEPEEESGVKEEELASSSKKTPKSPESTQKEGPEEEIQAQASSTSKVPIARALKTQEKIAESFDHTFQKATGVEINHEGDFVTFSTTIFVHGSITLMLLGLVSVLRLRFPQIYANNVRTKEEEGLETAPFTPSADFLGWLKAGWSVTVEQAQGTSGTDCALLLEFCDFSIKWLLCIGIPLTLVLCPLHFIFGGGTEKYPGPLSGEPTCESRLTMIGLNNLPDGSRIFWLHAVVVWYVVIVTEHMIFGAMAKFLKTRFEWLMNLDPPQSNTVMVEGIPPEWRSDQALKQFFDNLFPDKIETVVMVKQTWGLQELVAELEAKELVEERHEFTAHVRNRSSRDLDTPAHEARHATNSSKIRDEVRDLVKQVQAERARIAELASLPPPEKPTGYQLDINGDVSFASVGHALEDLSHVPLPCQARRSNTIYTENGFVTFKTDRDAKLAIHARFSADLEEFKISVPPHPNDIIYNDLRVSKIERRSKDLMGNACIFGVFMSFLPFILMVSESLDIDNLEHTSARFHKFMDDHYYLRPFLAGVMSTFALVLFMSFLPTVLMLIFRVFYHLKAHAFRQLLLQTFYFWFLVIFVLLITAFGASFMDLFQTANLLTKPTEVASTIAMSLPTATHFYLCYAVVQWPVHAMTCCRWVQLGKYLAFREYFKDSRVVEMSEPEDQDYYGIGGRSARWSFELVTAMVFCSLSPIILGLTLVSFLIARVTYGYVVVFAETRKYDLGGPFFVKKMVHLQFGVGLYITLMTGIFLERSMRFGPVLISGSAFIYWFYCLWRFQGAFHWEYLPFKDRCTPEAVAKAEEKMNLHRSLGSESLSYEAPELQEKPRTHLLNRFHSAVHLNVMDTFDQNPVDKDTA